MCSCNGGFTLSGDGRTCVEDNECTLETDNCEQVCVNTDGGFRCECNSGFVLNSDQATCSGKDLHIRSSIFYTPSCVNQELGMRS